MNLYQVHLLPLSILNICMNLISFEIKCDPDIEIVNRALFQYINDLAIGATKFLILTWAQLSSDGFIWSNDTNFTIPK